MSSLVYSRRLAVAEYETYHVDIYCRHSLLPLAVDRFNFRSIISLTRLMPFLLLDLSSCPLRLNYDSFACLPLLASLSMS